MTVVAIYHTLIILNTSKDAQWFVIRLKTNGYPQKMRQANSL